MPPIAIITDTDASLPEGLAAAHGIRQVPITVHFGQETYATGIDIDDAGLFARVNREGRLPTTAAPAPGAFAEAYEAALVAGAQNIICFCVSSEVSASYSAACAGRDMFLDREITVVDSRSLSLGQGFMVLAAAEAAAAGAPLAEILRIAYGVRERAHLYAALSTLKYLAMSGRVGHLTAGMADLLNVKPILTIRDGKLEMLERVRTQSRAWARVIELAALAAGGRPPERLAILHVDAEAAAHEFSRQLGAVLPCPDDLLYQGLTPGLSVHAGAGLVGVALVAAR